MGFLRHQHICVMHPKENLDQISNFTQPFADSALVVLNLHLSFSVFTTVKINSLCNFSNPTFNQNLLLHFPILSKCSLMKTPSRVEATLASSHAATKTCPTFWLDPWCRINLH